MMHGIGNNLNLKLKLYTCQNYLGGSASVSTTNKKNSPKPALIGENVHCLQLDIKMCHLKF